MAKKYVVEAFDVSGGVFKTQIAKLYEEIANYANKKNLTIVKVSDMDEKGRCAVIFEEL